jgi:hypothetical protein
MTEVVEPEEEEDERLKALRMEFFQGCDRQIFGELLNILNTNGL